MRAGAARFDAVDAVVIVRRLGYDDFRPDRVFVMLRIGRAVGCDDLQGLGGTV